MARLNATQAKKAGSMPGTLIYTGEARDAPVQLNLLQYSDTVVHEAQNLSLEAALARLEPDLVNWLDVVGVHDTELLAGIGEAFELHPLTREDIASVGQRPKIEFFDGYVYIVLRMLSLQEGGLEQEQVSLVLGERGLLVFQETPGDVFESVRERIRQQKGRISKLHADYLAYALMDAVVDTYFSLLEGYSDRLEDLEEAIYANPTPVVLAKLNTLKRELLFIRKAVWPLRDLLAALEREESPLFSAPVLTYLRDVYDHSIRIIETVELLRELLLGLHETYRSNLSFRMNEVMKVLTVIGTIFLPLTFLVGVYGMNFDVMPELHWPWAYPVLWLIMIGVATGMILYFRRRNWL